MIVIIFITAIFCALGVGVLRGYRTIVAAGTLFYAVQLLLALYIAFWDRDSISATFFTYDNFGVMFHLLLAVISPMVFYRSLKYIKYDSLREFRIYNASLIALCAATTGVYFANNIAVTWIFLEATTLATAGLVYHSRTMRSLEATWKYLFVSSVGIAIAYLGILMLSTAVTNEQGLSYKVLEQAVYGANPLYLQLAFLFMLTGYSCKMEIFPLFTVGVDANYAAPTPASALISTALVNAGFVAIFRMYKVFALSPVYEWISNVLVIVGLVSLVAGAVYLRRTNNFKRFLSYSTVENMGIATIGMGLGGYGIFAAVFHLMIHSLVKSAMYLQISQVGKIYGTYHMNRIGSYSRVFKFGSLTIILGMISLCAFPPSGFFISELLIFKEIVAERRWWLLVAMVVMICIVIYTVCRRILSMCFRDSDLTKVDTSSIDLPSAVMQFVLLAIAVICGTWLSPFIVEFINEML